MYKYLQERKDEVYILRGNCLIHNENKKELKMTFSIENIEDNAENVILELPYIYYLGYDISIETSKEIVKLNYTESENGLIQVFIPNNIEVAEVKVTYTGTVLEKLSYLLSALATLIFVVYVYLYRIKSKKGLQI